MTTRWPVDPIPDPSVRERLALTAVGVVCFLLAAFAPGAIHHAKCHADHDRGTYCGARP